MPIPTINHDGSLDVATGRHRRESNWKNVQVLWSRLLEKLSATHRTAETYAEYLAAKKPRQDEIKDIGGFVGGYLDKGKRRKSSVLNRQLITLDADFLTADSGLWEEFIMYYNNAACIYSTHKHSPDKPRLRLIVPLDREVMPDEYIAISRRIAGSIGIEFFDPTTYQPERLMYWPSTAKDGEFVFEMQDGPWLSADAILGTYRDWRDSSEWPMSDREKAIPLRAIKKQGDPLEKTGLVGAFCRTYSISEAIGKFLSDVYDPCDGVDDRFSFKEGSTHGGLVVYEDKYAYSHHGTDPVSGKLCNAFDLVRIHKFGLKDEDRDNERASFDEMIRFGMADPKTKLQMGREKISDATDDFAEEFTLQTGVEAETDDDKWKGEMDADKKGDYASTIKNIVLILRNHPALKGRLFLNEFEGRLIVTKALPWRKVTHNTRDFTDDDMDCLAHFLEDSCKVPFTHIQKALAIIRNENKIHPVREYLDGLKWDGEQRVERLFIDYLGAEDCDYSMAVARKTLIAAVARVFEPGIKFDNVLTFIGKEGVGKSTIVAKLARQWFSDCLGDIHGKEGMESLRGVWIMEVAEMASFRKADQEAIKRFISSREDQFRPAYGRQLVRYPRQCIFIATTNKQDFLNSGQGNRRFWPIETHVCEPRLDIFKDLTDTEIDQIWAEAVCYYKEGESLNLSAAMSLEAEKAREGHTEVDERTGSIREYLDTLLPNDWDNRTTWKRINWLNEPEELDPAGEVQRTYVCIAEIWCELFKSHVKDMNANNTKYIRDTMKKFKDWEPVKTVKRFKIYGAQRAYKRVTKSVTENVTNVTGETKNVTVVTKNVTSQKNSVTAN